MIIYTNIEEAWSSTNFENPQVQETNNKEETQKVTTNFIKPLINKECLIKIKDKKLINILNNYSDEYKSKYIEKILKEKERKSVYKEEFELILKVILIIIIIDLLKSLIS